MAVSETRVRPPEFIEAAGKTFLSDLSKATGDFKSADLSKVYGPQFVAGLDPLQQRAVKDLQAGLDSFKPFLQTAAARTGPDAFREFMSPFQRDVIDATLSEFDLQAQRGLGGIRDRAVAAGAFGGDRQAVQEAEFRSASDRNRAALQAQLLAQGFQQAQQAAIQGLQAQQGLGTFQSALGAQQRQLEQGKLAADQEAAREAAFADFTRLGLVGPQLASVIGGFPAATQTTSAPPPSTAQTLLGLGIGGAGLAGAVKSLF